jgi:acetyl-CoA acetyltransferase
MPQPVLAAGARTPIGRLLGSLSSLPATALGGVPMGVPATTVNKLCLSGLTAIA